MNFNIPTDEFNIASQLVLMASLLPVRMRNTSNEFISENIDVWEYGFLKSPTPSAIINESGKFQYVNEAFAHLVGFSRSELENKSYSSITHPDDINGHDTMIDRLLSGEQDHFTFQKRYITKFEHVVKVYLYVQVIEDSKSPKLFFIHVLPIEVYSTLLSEKSQNRSSTKNSKPFSKQFLADQIEKHWLAILTAIISAILGILNFVVDYNKQKWELDQLKNNKPQPVQISPEK